jgi:26S proteasome regulatory subunit N5
LAGHISFGTSEASKEVLDEWSQKISSVLEMIVKTNHLIAKEEMVEKISMKL